MQQAFINMITGETEEEVTSPLLLRRTDSRATGNSQAKTYLSMTLRTLS